jgi:hypothetical protein
MDAYYEMNLPQPILSVKLHKNTPAKLYEEMGRFLFTPGALTPSFFNDDSLFEVLSSKGVDSDDLADISIAGCQEPLIMGKDNGNTTNSWLNLPKILEMTLTGGVSTVTGEKLVEVERCKLENVREAFWANVEKFVAAMGEAANGASAAPCPQASSSFSSFARVSSLFSSRVIASWGICATEGRAMNTYLPHFILRRSRRTSSRRQRRTRLRVTALPTLPETEKPIFSSRPFRWINTRFFEG